MVAGRKLISITALLLVIGVIVALVFASCAELNQRPTRVAPGPVDLEATASPPDEATASPKGDRETVTIAGEVFHLEIANNDVTRQTGLMHRTSIPDDGGMLFVFPDAQKRSFWMAYCLVDMDLIFLDARGRVTATHRMKTQAPRGADESRFAYEQRMRSTDYASRFAAQFAIELKAGSLDRLKIAVEDRIDLDLARLKAAAR